MRAARMQLIAGVMLAGVVWFPSLSTAQFLLGAQRSQSTGIAEVIEFSELTFPGERPGPNRQSNNRPGALSLSQQGTPFSCTLPNLQGSNPQCFDCVNLVRNVDGPSQIQFTPKGGSPEVREIGVSGMIRVCGNVLIIPAGAAEQPASTD